MREGEMMMQKYGGGHMKMEEGHKMMQEGHRKMMEGKNNDDGRPIHDDRWRKEDGYGKEVRHQKASSLLPHSHQSDAVLRNNRRGLVAPPLRSVNGL